ncbi:MAG: hypothetical protein EXQ56_01905 [Acidobacteria bacterium]|nr:hypothetical protein [Acidobacteriota bacterium]
MLVLVAALSPKVRAELTTLQGVPDSRFSPQLLALPAETFTADDPGPPFTEGGLCSNSGLFLKHWDPRIAATPELLDQSNESALGGVTYLIAPFQGRFPQSARAAVACGSSGGVHYVKYTPTSSSTYNSTLYVKGRGLPGPPIRLFGTSDTITYRNKPETVGTFLDVWGLKKVLVE